MSLVRDQGTPFGGCNESFRCIGADPSNNLGPARSCSGLGFLRCNIRKPAAANFGRDVLEPRILHYSLHLFDRGDDETHAVAKPCSHLGRIRWRSAAPVTESTEPARDQYASDFGEEQSLVGDVNETVLTENDVKLSFHKWQPPGAT